jgi:hypothetical protein
MSIPVEINNNVYAKGYQATRTKGASKNPMERGHAKKIAAHNAGGLRKKHKEGGIKLTI